MRADDLTLADLVAFAEREQAAARRAGMPDWLFRAMLPFGLAVYVWWHDFRLVANRLADYVTSLT